jgi:Spy/CpxP family protein refolding chaperone
VRKTIPKFLLISAAGASLLLAQNAGTPPSPPSPATIAQHRVNALTARLGLNATQQAQALAFFTTAATTNSGLEAQLRTQRQNLKAAIEAPNNSTNIGTITAEIGTLTGEIALADATAEAQLYQILMPAQQATFSQGPGLGGPGGPGFGGGPRFRGHP